MTRWCGTPDHPTPAARIVGTLLLLLVVFASALVGPVAPEVVR